jgi:hypothetical protein
MKLQLIKAQKNLIKKLRTKFETTYVPDEKDLLSFLTALKLECFLAENAEVAWIQVLNEEGVLSRFEPSITGNKSFQNGKF